MTALRSIVTQQIGRRTWSFGLSWRSATEPDAIKAEARAEARLPSIKADLVGFRDDLQYALGYREPGDRAKGMMAAVAATRALAVQGQPTWIGLFSLDRGLFWVIEVTKDIIPPKGDRVYADLDEALASFVASVETRRWDRIYAPKQLVNAAINRVGTENPPPEFLDAVLVRCHREGTTTPIADLLAGYTAPYPQITRSGTTWPTLRALPTVAILGVLVVSVTTLTIYLPSLWSNPAVTPPAAAPPPTPVAPPPAPPADSPSPSMRLPRPSAVIAACFAAMTDLDRHWPAGWDAGTYDCSHQQLTAKFIRQPEIGRVESVRGAFPGSVIIIGDAGNDITVITPTTDPPMEARGETLESATDAREQLVALAQGADQAITLGSFTAPAGRDATKDLARWVLATMTITTDLTPQEWGRVLDTIPGLVVDRLVLDPADIHWKLEGSVYAQ